MYDSRVRLERLSYVAFGKREEEGDERKYIIKQIKTTTYHGCGLGDSGLGVEVKG
jgi:hypothetical protein